MIHREWCLQKHIKTFVRDAVDAEHEFRAFDRSMPSGQWTHMREKARGIRKATLDTLLEVAGFPDVWWECKWPPNHVEDGDDQDRTIRRLWQLGRYASWGVSVVEYCSFLKKCGVPLRQNCDFLAMHHQASVLSEIAKAELKAGEVPKAPAKPRARRATQAMLDRLRRNGVLV